MRDLAAKEPWFGGAKHAWIAQIDVDEYVLPVDPWSDLGETLERYGRAREWSLVLQRPWFGGGHAEAEVACAAAPPTFRFMRYGTAASALASRLGKPVVSTRALPKDLAAAWGPHRVPGLTRPDIFADVAGDRGLVLPHLKPQSFAEFSAKFQWNGFARNKYDASQATYHALVAATTGATDARLLRAPRVCARPRPPRAARSARAAPRALCDDCRALRRRALPRGRVAATGPHARRGRRVARAASRSSARARPTWRSRSARAGARRRARRRATRRRQRERRRGYADDGAATCVASTAPDAAVDATRVPDARVPRRRVAWAHAAALRPGVSRRAHAAGAGEDAVRRRAELRSRPPRRWTAGR